MGIERKFAVINAASQGIGAALVEAYDTLFVTGDIALSSTMARVPAIATERNGGGESSLPA